MVRMSHGAELGSMVWKDYLLYNLTVFTVTAVIVCCFLKCFKIQILFSNAKIKTYIFYNY